MARDRQHFKLQVNRMLDRLEGLPGALLDGSEADLAIALDASRTTIRAVLAHLSKAGILLWNGRQKQLLRTPNPGTASLPTRPEAARIGWRPLFLAWMLRENPAPGTALGETDLARRFGVPASAVREFLIRFEPFGLIEKHPNRHWVLKGFTRAFGNEMFTVRKMFELHALPDFVRACRPGGPLRSDLDALHAAHAALETGPDTALAAFPALDARFHGLICASTDNRFISDFSRMIAIIVHYHYRWNKHDELRRNRAAVTEHLAIIHAALAGDTPTAQQALETHLTTAYRTLMTSVPFNDGPFLGEPQGPAAAGIRPRLSPPLR